MNFKFLKVRIIILLTCIKNFKNILKTDKQTALTTVIPWPFLTSAFWHAAVMTSSIFPGSTRTGLCVRRGNAESQNGTEIPAQLQIDK